MRRLAQGFTLALLVAGMSIVPGTTGTAQGEAPSKPDSTQQLRDKARGKVKISYNKATGKAAFVRIGRHGDLLPGFRGAPRAKSDAFLNIYARTFGAPRSQLVSAGTSSDRYGTTVKYAQRYRGVPVFGAELRAHLDRQGDLQAVNGALVPVKGLSMRTTLSARAAAARAVAAVRADPPGEDGETTSVKGVRAKFSKLVVYRHGLVQGRKAGRTELVYQVEVTNGRNVRDMVFVTAVGGKVVNRYSLVHDALHRILYEARANNQGSVFFTKIWEEGDRYPGRLNPDQRSLVDGTGESYWFFRNAFERDSYDDAGHTMTTVNNDPRINCPNANWNGVTTNYCNGVSSDDVVAHEWAHAYTEYTSNLIYAWQSGAMNEAYSDIWGETVDLINGRQDADEGDIDAKRKDGFCSTHTTAVPQVVINSPADIQKVCAAGAASFGPQVTAAGLTDNVVLATDVAEPADAAAGLPAGTTTDGCTAPFANAAAVAGNIALIDRGRCTFLEKTKNAQAAGAVGVIIANTLGRGAFGMTGTDPTITIPTVGISNADGDRIKSRLDPGPVNVTMRDGASADKEDSYRWLIGEDSTAFGSAIRDMWTPTCKGDPGKVSDAEYVCDADDSGGVHSNSGVVNHGYSLLVDGGSYNGQNIGSIGLEKAAAIYWRAQTEYLVPVSDFTDLANSLEQSCVELIGKAIGQLSTAPNDASPFNAKIKANDCAQVRKMTAATELRVDPTDQCNWKPILDPNAPALCGGTATPVFSEDFEDGLTGWTTPPGTNPFGGPTFPWEASADAPAGNGDDGVAFGPDPDVGDCSGTATDASSVDYLVSSTINVPATGTAKMSFDHYVATEGGFDGGNVQVSVAGGAFAPVPAAAYTFNAPGTLTSAAGGNTNPLAGQPGFSGTNPGSHFGSWGTSHIDLSQLDVSGKSIVLRFAMGRDGCTGVDGWYVDNVNVITCTEPAAAARSGTKPARRDGSQA